MKQMVTEVLEKKGYLVGVEENPDLVVDVEIQKFWAWFSPGMWTVSFEARFLTIRRLGPKPDLLNPPPYLFRGHLVKGVT